MRGRYPIARTRVREALLACVCAALCLARASAQLPVPTATTLTSSANPAVAGTPLMLTSTVYATGGTVAGTVQFYDATVLLGSGTLSAGTAVLTTTTLTVGTHSLVACYAQSPGYSPTCSPTLLQVVTQAGVTQAPTTTVLVSSLNPSTYSQSVTFSGQVAASTGTPQGTVDIFDSKTLLTQVTLDGFGQYSWTTANLTIGIHSLTACFEGTAAFQPTCSATLLEQVNAIGPDVSVTNVVSDANPAVYGSAIDLTATVTPPTGHTNVPTGTVAFWDAATAIGSVTLNPAAQGTVTTSSLTIGTHYITASYSGDAQTPPSTSKQLLQVVTNAAGGQAAQYFTIAVTPSPATIVFGSSTTYTVTLARVGPFAQAVTLTCAMPAEMKCTLPAGALQLQTSASGAVTMQVTAQTPTVCDAGVGGDASPWWIVAGVLALCAGVRMRRSVAGRMLLTAALLCVLPLLNACSVGGCLDKGTQPGNYTFSITGTTTGAINAQQTQSFPITVTLQ